MLYTAKLEPVNVICTNWSIKMNRIYNNNNNKKELLNKVLPKPFPFYHLFQKIFSIRLFMRRS